MGHLNIVLQTGWFLFSIPTDAIRINQIKEIQIKSKILRMLRKMVLVELRRCERILTIIVGQFRWGFWVDWWCKWFSEESWTMVDLIPWDLPLVSAALTQTLLSHLNSISVHQGCYWTLRSHSSGELSISKVSENGDKGRDGCARMSRCIRNREHIHQRIRMQRRPVMEYINSNGENRYLIF